MSNIVLSYIDIKTIFQNLTISLLGLPEPTEEDKLSYSKVRIAYQSSGQPSNAIHEDITYISIFEKEGEYAIPREWVMQPLDDDNANKQTVYTRIHEITWTQYGPSSYDNIRVIRDGLFSDATTEYLLKNNLHLVPSNIIPQRNPELFQAQWWERYDLKIKFNEKVTLNETVPYLKSAEITVMKENGDEEIVSVTEELYEEMQTEGG